MLICPLQAQVTHSSDVQNLAVNRMWISLNKQGFIFGCTRS